MPAWYPGLVDYVEWAQEESFLSHFKNSPNKQAISIRQSIRESTEKQTEAQMAAMSENAREIIASNQQIKSSIEEGFYRLARINKQGFTDVRSAIEAMHSDMNYNFGLLTQQIEFQNQILSNILNVLVRPFGSRLEEVYEYGCDFFRKGKLKNAIGCFNDSIDLKMGKYFFPSHYQLGLLYLKGKNKKENVKDPLEAANYFLKVIDLVEDNTETNDKLNPFLADCKFFLSQSYYFQLPGKTKSSTTNLLNMAIEAAEEAVEANPNLSQGYYHLAKYYAYKNDVDTFLFYLKTAIEIDRKYSLDVFQDGVFEKHEKHIIELINELRISKRKILAPKLKAEEHEIAKFEQKEIPATFSVFEKYKKGKSLLQLARKKFQTNTYFGLDDCQITLEQYNNL